MVHYSFTANSNGSRTAHIRLLGTNIAITQAGLFTVALGTNAVTESGTAGRDSVALTISSPGGPWTAVANESWLHLDPASQGGVGSAIVTFAFDANQGPPRTGTLTVGGQRVTVTQLGRNRLGTSALFEGPAAGADSVVLAIFGPVTDWTTSANDSWLHLNAGNQSGSGSTNVIFGFDANPGPMRTGTLTVAGLPLTVTQAGATYVPANPITNLVPSGLKSPWGVAMDDSGNIYVADSGNNAIKKWTAASRTLATLVSLGTNSPQGLAVDGDGNVYFSDFLHHSVGKWTVASGGLMTLVSSGLFYPQGVAVDGVGNVYIADSGNNAVKKWTAASGIVTTLVSSALSYPSGVAVDSAGNVYIADTQHNAIEKWTAASGTLSTLAGGLFYPQDVAVDGAGNVYFSGGGVGKWSAAGGYVTTLASSALSGPLGLAADNTGNVFVSDSRNGAIKEVLRVYLDPMPRTISANAGVSTLPAVLPLTENLANALTPYSDWPWLTIKGVTNGVVSYSATENDTDESRTGNLTLLGQRIFITQEASAKTPILSTPLWLPDGGIQFGFTGPVGSSYSVLFSTNVAFPLSTWAGAGAAVEIAPGQFQFTATPARPTINGFYRVRSP